MSIFLRNEEKFFNANGIHLFAFERKKNFWRWVHFLCFRKRTIISDKNILCVRTWGWFNTISFPCVTCSRKKKLLSCGNFSLRHSCIWSCDERANCIAINFFLLKEIFTARLRLNVIWQDAKKRSTCDLICAPLSS